VSVSVVICAAGKGTRAGFDKNKVLKSWQNEPVVLKTVQLFLPYADEIIVTHSEKDTQEMSALFKSFEKVKLTLGGATRFESVYNALKLVTGEITLVHDGARPFVSDEIIDESIESAINYGSGVVAYSSTNALKKVVDGKAQSVDRQDYYVVQTPQSFNYEKLMDAYARVDGSYADDSEVLERAGYDVHITSGSRDNIKLTTPSDFLGLNGAYRVGYGFDVHAFCENRKLVLCGKTIDYPLGLLGHSDADAPVHAIMDALLSACSLPDIGVLFPDTDPAFKGANSMHLLAEVMKKITDYEIINVSVCIITQKPKIAPHVMDMRQNLASALAIDVGYVNVSATTTEHLGITGEGKGLASSAMVLVRKK
jgi:2-C-methyl-D-erythritol 2,4-cyclodiphosphate synthase/2-C-methyl-D-erythritol 4-phosphate cytidylyltransferase